VRGLDAVSADLREACAAYEAAIAEAGGVDLQLLGIGTDGTSGSTSQARRSPPAPASRRSPTHPHDNARFFLSLDAVPLTW
jgi:glucosamine-6-phosphate deaminase